MHLLRALVFCVVMMAIGAGAFVAPAGAAPILSGSNPIVLENRRDGTQLWQLFNPAPNGEIAGYASATSVNRGGTIELFVSTTDNTYSIDIYRMGWYAGTGGRLVVSLPHRAGIRQVVPSPDAATGLIECHWIAPVDVTTSNPSDPSDWPTGFYLAKLTGDQSGYQSYIIFVVRDDARPADLLFQSSVTTYQAYNAWGGKSLYGTLAGRNTDLANRAFKVSFNRPYYANGLAKELYGAGLFFEWEYDMVRFLEQEGYDVAYSTDVDVHEDGRTLLNYRGLLVVGHGEYWSYEMRKNVEAARDHGVSLGFFAADTCSWQIRFQPDTDGNPDRTIVCYKVGARLPDGSLVPASLDPASSNPANYYLLTTLFELPHVTLPGDPEERLIGVMHSGHGETDIVVTDVSNWVFAGTGLRSGDHLTGLCGAEVDSMHGFSPPDTVRLAHSPVVEGPGLVRYSDMTVYQALSGATVFASGSFQWSWGLDDGFYHPDRVNAAAQQITRNVLSRFLDRK